MHSYFVYVEHDSCGYLPAVGIISSPVDTACCCGSSHTELHSLYSEGRYILCQNLYFTLVTMHSRVSQDSLCGFIIFNGIQAHFLVEVHLPNNNLKLCKPITNTAFAFHQQWFSGRFGFKDWKCVVKK